MKVAIAGYGTAGQAAAILLSEQGHDVTVFDASRVRTGTRIVGYDASSHLLTDATGAVLPGARGPTLSILTGELCYPASRAEPIGSAVSAKS